MEGLVRHEDSCDGLEKQCNHVQGTGDECADSSAESQQAGEKRADGKEEADQNEGKHESGEVEELSGADELLRDTFGGIESTATRRIKRVSRVYAIA